MNKTLFIWIFAGTTLFARGQEPIYPESDEILLYEKLPEIVTEEQVRDNAGNLIVSKVTSPSITPFLPARAMTPGTAVIICPGGGYQNLHIQREGFRVAEAFRARGIAAFVLKYRLPDSDIVNGKSFVPLKDAQRAIQLVRENAAQWNIAPDKIGIMGFSAGGHLAASAGVHSDSVLIDNEQGTSLRPDFMILVYPVISFDEKVGHVGSKVQLLGKSPDRKWVNFFSNDKWINTQTPRTILFHASDDTVVPVENSLLFYNALIDNNILAELHLYSRGNHGFGSTPPFDKWFNLCVDWLKTEGLAELVANN